MTELETARAALAGRTLALCKDGEIITSDGRGVSPMLGFIREGKDLAGYFAADRVVGRAAAMLFVKAGVRAVYADVMSVGAERLLKAHGVETLCDTLADGILNRDKTGPCPMESAVCDTDDIDGGVLMIIKKADEMKRSRG